MPEMQEDLLTNRNTVCDGFTKASLLFNNDRANGNASASATASVTVSFDAPRIASFVTLTCSTQTAPDSFELLGSNDGESWVSLERRTDLDFTWDLYLRSFKINSDEAYSSYKLVFTSDAQFEIAEIELIGK
jgi:hypothetical protein